jgi:hypothetical protein
MRTTFVYTVVVQLSGIRLLVTVDGAVPMFLRA